jgi:hypothetical protein
MHSNFESFALFEYIRTSPTHAERVRSMFEKAKPHPVLMRSWDDTGLLSACFRRISIRSKRVAKLACYAVTDMEDTWEMAPLSRIQWGTLVSMLEDIWGMPTSEEDTHGYEDS